MSNFDEIIKQKIEQFDVPFNEAHWKGVENKLDAIKVARIKKNTFIAAGVITIASILGFLMYEPETPTNVISERTTEVPVQDYTSNKKEVTNQLKNNTAQPKETLSLETNQDKTEKNTNIVTEANEATLHNDPIVIENKELENSSQPNTTLLNNSQKEALLSADFIVFNNRVCLGEQVSFEAVETNNVSYLWDFGDGTTSTQTNPTHNYLKAGDYTVSLTVTHKDSRKKATSKVKSAASILPLPAAKFTYLEQAEKYDANKLKYPYTIFSTKGDKSDTYFWSFGNGQTSKEASPKTIYSEKGVFKTSLTITNSFGCSNTLSKPVTINLPFTLYAPNAFSPNHDGDNDIFIPKGLLTWDVQFEMIIKNKSGEVIYKTTDKYAGWNGKYNNTGIVLDAGIYFWQVITYDAEGTSHQHVGKINLIK